jgi:hypothetical protein
MRNLYKAVDGVYLPPGSDDPSLANPVLGVFQARSVCNTNYVGSNDQENVESLYENDSLGFELGNSALIFSLTCKNLDNSYFSLSLKWQVMVGTMEDSGYAINGRLWKVKKGYKQQRIACI